MATKFTITIDKDRLQDVIEQHANAVLFRRRVRVVELKNKDRYGSIEVEATVEEVDEPAAPDSQKRWYTVVNGVAGVTTVESDFNRVVLAPGERCWISDRGEIERDARLVTSKTEEVTP